jgi:signal transduction histidine kinase
VTVLWCMEAAAALTLGVSYGMVWFADRRNLANLMFCLLAIAVAGVARAEVGLMHAATVAEYVAWVRWAHLPLFAGFIAQLLFVYYYLGTGRSWLLWTIIAARIAVLVGNFQFYPSLSWREIGSLGHVSFLGEQVSVVGEGVLRSWQWLPSVSRVLMVVFVADAVLQLWRTRRPESRRKALVVACGIGIPLLSAVLLGQVKVLEGLHMPPVQTALFVATLLVMAFELSRGLFLNQRARRELEELRSEVARAGRVTALGQLASSLAHELSQPLGAILRNAEAAELHLNGPAPDLEELRAIVADIRRDDRRAGDVIDQMRALIKRRTLEMQPLLLDEVVHDVISMVHADAVARHVALDCVMPPGLPQVKGDRVHLSQVLLNLIINGMDAMQSSRANTKRVVIEAQPRTHGRVEVTVTDSGPGVPPEVIGKVFEPFFTTKSGGMGMGLPISRTIIEAHGGRLWAEHGRGPGLTFRFTLQQAGGHVS